MLGKLILYNLKYGKKVFFMTAAIILSITTLFGFSNENNFIGITLGLFILFAPIVILAVTVIIVVKNYNKNLFKNQGYFTLTLPVKRNEIILSHWITSIIWVNFIFLTCLLSIFINSFVFKNELIDSFIYMHMHSIINFQNIIVSIIFSFISINILSTFYILFIFMCLTFFNTSFNGKRLNFFLKTLFVCVVLIVNSIISTIVSVNTHLFIVYNIIHDKISVSIKNSDVLGYNDYFKLNVYSIILMIVTSIIFYYITKYLLNKKIDLR